MPCPFTCPRVTTDTACGGLAQAGVGLGAGRRPLGSPAHYGTGGGFMLGLNRHPHLTQDGIVPCCSAGCHYGMHLSLQAEAIAREGTRRAK